MPKSFLKDTGSRGMGEQVVVGDEFEGKEYTSTSSVDGFE